MMGVHDWVQNEIDKLRQWVKQSIFSVSRYTKIANSTASGQGDKVEGQPDSGAQEVTRRMSTWGVRSRPPAGVECTVVRVGGALGGVIVAAESEKYGPSDLGDGETAVYNKIDDCLMKLEALGSIYIKVPIGEFLTLGDGAAADFLIKGTTFRTAQALLNGQIAAAGAACTAASGDPLLNALMPTAAAGLALAGSSLSSGAAAFEGASATYLSQVVKVK